MLRIPNLVARGLYVERLRERWLPQTGLDRELGPAIRRLGQQGDLAPLADLIEQGYVWVLSNRDYRWTNELLVKFAFLTLLFDDRLYMAVSELETDRGYADLALILRPDMRRFQALDLLLDLKYLGLKELGLSGEEVRTHSRESLAALPAVAAKLDEAAAQATDYGASVAKPKEPGPPGPRPSVKVCALDHAAAAIQPHPEVAPTIGGPTAPLQAVARRNVEPPIVGPTKACVWSDQPAARVRIPAQSRSFTRHDG